MALGAAVSVGIDGDPFHSSHHMRVDFLFAVNIGRRSGELQQLVGLVNDQRGVEFAQFRQLAAEHSARTNAAMVKHANLHDRQRISTLLSVCASSCTCGSLQCISGC